MIRQNWLRTSIGFAIGLTAALAITLALFQQEVMGSDEIAIGAALPLSGAVSYYGQDSKRGIDLAVDEINTAGGINGQRVRVIYEDTQGQGTRAVSAIRALLDVQNVPAVIGGGTSTETLSMAPIAERSQRVLISPVSSASKISQSGSYIFRSVPSDGAQAVNLAEWIVQRGVTRLALIYVNQAWGVGLKDDFVSNYQRLGGELLTQEATDQGEVDFRTQLVRMRASNPQAYLAIIYAREGGLLLRQARELGISDQFFGADPWTKKEFIESAGEAAGDGVLFTTPALYDGAEFKAFAKDFRARYNRDPGVYEAHGYDCMKLLALAMQQGGTSPVAIRDSLAAISGYMGATGNTTFDENGDVPTKGFARMTWTSGKLERIK